MIDIDSALAELSTRIDYPATPELANRVVRAIATQRRSRRRTLRLGIAVAGIVAVVAFIPASRDQVAAWLGLRGVTIIETPFDSPAGNGLELGSPVSLEEATRRAGFEPLLSSNLGEPYNVFVENGRIWMLFEPGPLLPEMSLPGVGAIVMQFRPEHGPGIVKGVGVEGAEYIQFGGVFAVWIEGPHELMLMVPSGNAGDGRSVGNTLLWETESLTIRIETGLTQPSVLEIARSFR